MADSGAPESHVPDPRLALLEQQLERERETSRQAAAQLTALSHQESRIARNERPPDPPIQASGWTVETTMAHLLALREGDRRFYEERDRRYAEVNVEKEKALKIKETADLAALQLAREIQTYKDEKANELREQINSERGNYASKEDLENAKRELNATIKPIGEYVSAQQGGHTRERETASERHLSTTSATAILMVVAAFLSIVVVVAVATHGFTR